MYSVHLTSHTCPGKVEQDKEQGPAHVYPINQQLEWTSHHPQAILPLCAQAQLTLLPIS